MSLRQTAAWAQLSGVADLTDASLNDRLHQSCDFLAAIVTHLLQAKAPGPRAKAKRSKAFASGTPRRRTSARFSKASASRSKPLLSRARRSGQSRSRRDAESCISPMNHNTIRPVQNLS